MEPKIHSGLQVYRNKYEASYIGITSVKVFTDATNQNLTCKSCDLVALMNLFT